MSKFLLPIFLSSWLSNLGLTCAPQEDYSASAPGSSPFPYQLDQPDATYDMDEGLKEISGLSLDASGQSIAAVSDEKGVIFLIDKNTGTLQQQVPFWNDGDFEGIEVVGNDIWAVKSSGSLFRIKDYAAPNPKAEKFTSFLTKENDVEGLSFDPTRNSLLIACKGMGVKEDGWALKKSVFAFDLNTLSLGASPVFTLSLSQVQAFLSQSPDLPEEGRKKLLEDFNGDGQELKFSPSGLAIHPATGDVYITSARGNMLLVLDPAGNIKYIEKLRKKTHAQPEGICFDKDGTLFIANEGKDGPGRIYKFNYKAS